MKTNRKNHFQTSTLQLLVAASCCIGGLTTKASALTYYWDGNGTTTGAGDNAANTASWGVAANWGTLANGTSATTAAAITGADTVVFTAYDGIPANNPNGNYTVTLASAQSVAGIVIGDPIAAGNDGTLNLWGTGAPGLSIGSGGVTLQGSNGDPKFNASIGTITLTADQTWTTNNFHVWEIHAPVQGDATTGNTRTWTLGRIPAYTAQYTGIISDGSAGGKLALTLDNSDGGTTYITGTASTFTGKTTITRGLLQVRSLADAGIASSLGAPVGADSIIDIGSGTFNGTLKFNGAAPSSSNRVINMAGTTGEVSIINDSGNPLSLTGSVTNAGGGNKILRLRGSNTGANSIGPIADAGDLSTTAVSKQDAGKWTVTGNSSFTGGLTISNGSLVFSGASNSFDGPINVSGGASTLLTFGGSTNFSQGMEVYGGTVIIGASGALGQDVSGNDILVSGGNLQFNADSGYTDSFRDIIIAAGGIGIGPGGVLPDYIDATSNGVVIGLNLVGDAGITGLTGQSFLGSFTGGTFTGASLTPGNASTYRLGGGGGHLIIQNNILVGANNLVVGSTGGGTVTLPGANTYTGTTTLQNGILNVSSINSVAGGSGSSSLGAPTTVLDGTIALGNGSNNVTLNYTGTGETTDRVLSFAGTSGTVTLGNSGSGNIVYSSTPTFSGSGARTIQLGASSDTSGGSINGLADEGLNKTSVSKAGLTNSTWQLTGNTFTGNIQIDGGVLGCALAGLSNSYINLSGDNQTHLAVLQTSGVLARTISGVPDPANIQFGANSGFAAKGGSLTVTLDGDAPLTWGSPYFLGSGTDHLVFGSSTADSQVEFTNDINLNTGDAFERRIYVEQGVGGDSALLSGVLSPGMLGGGGPAPTGLQKIGGGTLILGGDNTYPGLTGVVAGTLLVNGSTSTGNVIVSSGATLGGTGTINGPVTINAGATLAPGASIGTTTATSSVSLAAVGSVLDIELNASISDRLDVTGALTITGATLNITALATPTAPVYVIASYGSLVGTEFAAVSGLPSGYEVKTDYAGGTQVALVAVGEGTAYDNWASFYMLEGVNALPGSDPDFDGVSNLVEFGLNGNPDSGSSNGLLYGKMATVDAVPNVLTFTIAVRDGATFSADGNRMKSNLVDDIVYTVEASNNLSDWGGPVVTEVTGADAIAIQSGLVTPDDDWSYKTFRTDGSSSSDTTDFIRVGIE